MTVLGVPLDLTGYRRGSSLGPAAVRLAGLDRALEELGLPLMDKGDVSIETACASTGIRNFRPLIDCLAKTKVEVKSILSKGEMPLVIGGDHTIAMATVSAALEEFGDDLAVLWIDAHADLNTPGTTPSGNAHGMVVAALMGFVSGKTGQEDLQWRDVLGKIIPEKRLKPSQLAWFAIRELDAGERERINTFHEAFIATMHAIDRDGMIGSLDRLDAWLRASGAKNLWISFDVDALDPFLAPGTGTAVHGGLSYREMHLMGEVLWEYFARPDCPYRLVGLDLVETNPIADSNNVTARTAVEWIASLFGKGILRRPS